MKQQAENVTIDTLQMPATGTINLFGHEIPVTDYVTVGEAVELEKLVERQDLSAIEMNIESIAIMIRHRLGKPINAKDLQRQPLTDIEAFEEGVDQLLRPFTVAYVAAKRARAAKLRTGILAAVKSIGAASRVN